MSQNRHNTSLQTPLARARGLGSAKKGVGHHVLMQYTSIALIPLMLYIFWIAPTFLPEPQDYEAALVAIGNPITSMALILTIAIVCLHVALGLQTIIEDYVSCRISRKFLVLFAKLGCLVVAVAGLYAVLYISFTLLA